jgi:hypothetical protein
VLLKLSLAAFNYLRLAAVVGRRLFGVLSGISNDLPNVADMRTGPSFERSMENLKPRPVLWLLWADPQKRNRYFRRVSAVSVRDLALMPALISCA